MSTMCFQSYLCLNKIIGNGKFNFNKQKDIDKYNTVIDLREKIHKYFEELTELYGKDKMRRLNSLLSGVKESNFGTNKNKPKKCKYIDLEDKMFNKIVKYMEPNVKNKFIISKRISIFQIRFINI